MRCPFHGSVDDDMYLNQNSETWYCFGRCKTGGNVIRWFQLENPSLTYKQVIDRLAKMVGLSLAPPKERTRLLAQVMRIYRDNLKNNERAQDYLRRRGIQDRMWLQLNIGYAAGIPEGLPWGELHAANLLYGDPGEVPRPWCQDRIVFALHTKQGEVIHLQGRAIDPKDKPKYQALAKNTEHGTFSIDDYLYGEEFLNTRNKDAFLQEGAPDTAIVRQYDLAAFGVMGNDGFAHHAHKLNRFENLHALFDNDASSRERSLPELARMQLRMPNTTIWDVVLPKPEGQAKEDVNGWYLNNGMPSVDAFLSMVHANRRPVIAASIHQWGSDLRRHPALIDMIHDHRERDRWLWELSKVSGEPLSALEYHARVRSSYQ